MSKIVTFEQAKKLKELGFDGECLYWYNEDGVKECPIDQGYMEYYYEVDCFLNYWNAKKIDRDLYGSYPPKVSYSVPTVSEALDWVREEKGIECGVLPICESFAKDNTDGSLSMSTMFVGYDYNFFDKSSDKGEIVNMVTYSTHSLASSALLDAVLTYLEQKEQK